jgi:outer membrane protein, multidrug efflux system
MKGTHVPRADPWPRRGGERVSPPTPSAGQALRPRRLGLPGLLALTQVLLACSGPPVLPHPVAPGDLALPQAFRQGTPPSSGAGAPASAGWGALFDESGLDELQERALQRNAEVQQAAARTAQAQAAQRLAQAQQQPLLGASAGASRQVGPLINDAGAQGNLFAAALDVQLTLDPLQRLSRAQQAAELDVLAARAAEAAVRLRVRADVARAWLDGRAAQAEMSLAEATRQHGDELVSAAEAQVHAGLATPTAVAAEAAELRSDQREHGHALGRFVRAELALATLMAEPQVRPFGVTPPAGPLAGPGSTHTLRVPDIPPGLPVQLLARRPDLAEAALRVQAAQGRVDLARDAWFPALTLTASAGTASAELGRWLRAAATGGALGVLLQVPDLLGGRRDADRDAVAASLALEAATYRGRVLEALREVEEQLSRQQQLVRQFELAGQALAAAEQEVARIQQRVQAGLAAPVDALRARRQALRLAREHVQLAADRQQAAVALLQALGGAWADPGVTVRVSRVR